MIKLGARVQARLNGGDMVTGRVTASWDGGVLVLPDHPCQRHDCPCRTPVAVRDHQVVVRWATTES